MDTVCHLQSYTNKQGIIMFCELYEDDQQMILLRTKLSSGSIHSVCEHHFAHYITSFVNLQKTCCNPFGAHRKSISLLKGKGLTISIFVKLLLVMLT